MQATSKTPSPVTVPAAIVHAGASHTPRHKNVLVLAAHPGAAEAAAQTAWLPIIHGTATFHVDYDPAVFDTPTVGMLVSR